MNCCGHTDSQGDTRNQEASYNRVIAWLTGVLAFAALVQIGVTIAQAIFMSDGLKLTKLAADAAKENADAAITSAKVSETSIELARLDQRAWVTVAETKFEEPPEVGRNPTVEVTLINTGRSPALRVRFAGTVFARNRNGEIPAPDAEERPTTQPFSRMIIAPGATIETRFTCTEPIANEPTLNLIRLSATLTLFVQGFIEYEDVFGTSHKTTFSYFWGGLKNDRFLAFDRWNEAA